MVAETEESQLDPPDPAIIRRALDGLYSDYDAANILADATRYHLELLSRCFDLIRDEAVATEVMAVLGIATL